MSNQVTTARVGAGTTTGGIDELEDTGSDSLTEYVKERQMSLSEAMDKYDLVGATHDPVNGSFVVLADRQAGIPFANMDGGFREMGFTSPSPFTSWTRDEWNPKLRGKLGTREYYKMKRQDGIIRGSLRLLKTPLQAGRWFIEPGSQSATDKKIAEFVGKCLFEWLNVSWSTLLSDILLMCEYGYIAFEKVWKFNDAGQVVLQKLAPRHPLDIQDWEYDAEGGPDGIVMEPNLHQDGFSDAKRFIPIKKLAVFTMEAEAGDLSGISVLRSAYKHYYYKDTLYKIDAIQKERHGIGVPVIKLPPGFSPADKALADQLGRNLRTNERAHVVLPPNWELIFAVLEGQPVDCISSINHHNMQIMANILAPFLEDSSVDPKSTDMFLKSTRYIGMSVVDIFNKFIIPELVNYNWTLGRDRCYPTLRVRRVGEQEDLRTMSFTFRNFVGARAITPDDELEDFLRKELDLPARDPSTSRPDPATMAADLAADQAADAEHQAENGDEDTRPDTRGDVDPDAPRVGTRTRPDRAGAPRQTAPKATVGAKNIGTDRNGRS
jgi:hypothetical protein